MPERDVKIVNKLGIHARPAAEIVKTWLTTPFAGGRHQKRIDEIDAG